MKHYNTTISEDATRILNLKGESTDFVNDELTPVVLIQRYANITRSQTVSVTGSTTIFTTPTDKDFYLTGFSLAYAADANSDGTSSAIVTTIEGVTRGIAYLRKVTLTAYAGAIATSINPPIKVDRGVNITLLKSFAAGNENHSGVIYGYTVETTKGV